MSSIIESNFNLAVQSLKELVDKEMSNNQSIGKFTLVQAAYNKHTFELYSAALSATEDDAIPDSMANDPYYNLVFVNENTEEIVKQFRDKYMFKLAYSDASFALYQAYRLALMTETGEYTHTVSFSKPDIEDSTWAYNDVFQFTELGQFLCWFNYDEEYNRVEIQADVDLIKQYDELTPMETTEL